jgi:Sulfotransferase domain
MTVSLKNIIVVGYPKSGNTWITRLTADLLGCPIKGFWKEPESYEIACEGQDRVSPLQCFKAHHSLHELDLDINSSENKIIYVVRDPRDVALSGAHFFEFNRLPKVREALEKVPLGRALYNKIVYKIVHYERCKIEQMTSAILHGNQDLSWCHIPWSKHYKSYVNRPVLFVRYEDMLSDPLKECVKILNYLNQKRDLSFIEAVIERQSFHQKKLEFRQKKEKDKVVFMRSGKSGEWRKKLSPSQKDKLQSYLLEDLKFLAYEI